MSEKNHGHAPSGDQYKKDIFEEVRPWGKFRSFPHTPARSIKIITVNPGGTLSLQYHHNRSEFWVVLDKKSGEAQIFTTLSDAVRFTGISRSKIERAVKSSKLAYSERFIVSLASGINKNQERIKQGMRANFGRNMTH